MRTHLVRDLGWATAQTIGIAAAAYILLGVWWLVFGEDP